MKFNEDLIYLARNISSEKYILIVKDSYDSIFNNTLFQIEVVNHGIPLETKIEVDGVSTFVPTVEFLSTVELLSELTIDDFEFVFLVKGLTKTNSMIIIESLSTDVISQTIQSYKNMINEEQKRLNSDENKLKVAISKFNSLSPIELNRVLQRIILEGKGE